SQFQQLIISKMDSVTHNNLFTADDQGLAQKMWAAIKEHFASSQASNRARIFNDFLYIKFQEECVETFVTDVSPMEGKQGGIILDSGASGHIFNDLRFINTIETGEFDFIKTGKKDATLPIKGKGSVTLTWGGQTIQLKNCLYVPDIVINLVSAEFKVEKAKKLVLEGKISNGLFSIQNPDSVGSEKISNLSESSESLQELHEKFGHASIQQIEHLASRPISQTEKENFECKACTLAKITKQPFKAISQLASKPFERLHMDLIGPIKPESSLKHNYILTMVDNHSGYLAGFPLVHKSKTMEAIIDLLEAEKSC
ncbi:hypothetical protein VP01_7500g1, partial [Puccinia sorghi]